MMTDIYDANATEPVTETNFVWPEQPAEDWWLTQGAAIGMDSDTIRFAAALHNLGGADAKKNSKAAQLAGLGWNRVESFRAARSVSVQKLLREAKDIKRGRLPPLTEAEIDQKVDDLIRCPDALTVARGIELREKRKHTSGGGMSFDNLTPLDEVMVLVLVSCRYGQCRPETWPLFWAELLLPRDGWSCPLIRQMAPFLKQRYPQHWRNGGRMNCGHSNLVRFCDRIRSLRSVSIILRHSSRSLTRWATSMPARTPTRSYDVLD
jgi:hypothetical protein